MSYPQRADRLAIEPVTPAPMNPGILASHAGEVCPPELHVTFPWPSLRETAGPMLPGRLYIVSARTGSGKTLFVRSLLEHWLYAAEPTPVAMWPTETDPAELVRALAASRLGVHPARIEEGDFSRVEGGERAFRDVVADIALALCSSGQGHVKPLWLYGESRPRVGDIRRALKAFAEDGGRVFVVDHLLRLALDLRDLFASASEAIREFKQLAQDFGLVGIVTSQQGRATGGGDRLAWFAPPDLSALKGSGALEEEADGVLFLHRVLRHDLTDADMAEIRRGRKALKDAIDPTIMGVAVGKARVDGSRVHGQCYLRVEHGQVSELPAPQVRDGEAAAHGIRTGGRF